MREIDYFNKKYCRERKVGYPNIELSSQLTQLNENFHK